MRQPAIAFGAGVGACRNPDLVTRQGFVCGVLYGAAARLLSAPQSVASSPEIATQMNPSPISSCPICEVSPGMACASRETGPPTSHTRATLRPRARARVISRWGFAVLIPPHFRRSCPWLRQVAGMLRFQPAASLDGVDGRTVLKLTAGPRVAILHVSLFVSPHDRDAADIHVRHAAQIGVRP